MAANQFPVSASFMYLLILVAAALGTASEAEKDSEDRLIPPFSPSLELARSLGSSPVTPQGKENPTLENPKEASGRMGLSATDDQFTEDTQVVSGDSDDLYDRTVGFDRGQDLVDDDDEENVNPLADLPLDEEGVCPPNLPQEYSTWRRSIRVVRATLPHQVFSSCSPLFRCSVSTTVLRRVYLQDGDTLEVVLQTPPDYTPPPPSSGTPTHTTPSPTPSPAPTPSLTSTPEHTTTEVFLEETTTTSAPPPSTSQPPQPLPSQHPPQQHPQHAPQPQHHPQHPERPPPSSNSTHLFSRADHPAHTSTPLRRKREAMAALSPPPSVAPTRRPKGVLKEEKKRRKKGEEKEKKEETGGGKNKDHNQNQTATSPLTLWKASLAEWASCSTREGSQMSESGAEGVVTVPPRYLQVGNSYFIGRSSWSSTECFKLKVTVRSAECGEGSLCSGKGVCYAKPTMEHYQCECCEGYIGSHCEERDACQSDPCRNAGICVDIVEGHDGDTFQCLCPYGYRGRYCEERTNLCESGPCKNGATCTGNHSSYSCHCPSGWTGPQCLDRSRDMGPGEEVTGCAAGPCVHGVCVETSTMGVRCFCQPGFGGQRCEFEYDECCSSPCVNGGTCVDHIGGYECLCGRGYTGTRCDIKLCMPNPCDNGGTCWNLPDANVFYCACRPGFTGTTCQDETIQETVGAVGTVESVPMEIHLPMETPLDHMKNIYVAIVTLAAALLIFILVVGACHCRVNRTYRKFLMKLPRPRKVIPTVKRPRPTSLFEKPRRGDRSGALRLEAEPDGASMPMTSSNSNSDAVYYNMDVCDNQELPLIK